MTSSLNCGVAIVGGGPGGVDAALACAGRGLDVLLVEERDLGGVCLNRGCIPTKLYLAAIAPLAELKAQAKYKLYPADTASASTAGFSMPALLARKNRLITGLRQATAKRLMEAGVRVLQGRATLSSPTSLLVASEDGENEVAFNHAIIATGSHPAYPPGLEPDNNRVLGSTQLLDLEEAPERLLVIGAGAVGLELAGFFHALGTKVSIVEAQDRLAPVEDPDVSTLIERLLKREKYSLYIGSPGVNLARDEHEVRLTLASGEVVVAEKCLVALGRRANTANLGLDVLGVEPGNAGFLATDEYLRVSDAVLAIGDVNGRWLLAHAAQHQGEYAARFLAKETSEPYDAGPMPSCVYGPVESFRAGKSQAELTAQGGEIAVSRENLPANPMAQAHGGSQGFVKVLWQDGRVAGITGAGHGVTAMASMASAIVASAWTGEQAQHFVFPHPGLDETLKQALLTPQELLA
ncbi:MAG: 2-oxoglutarate dehydrogenase [Desulfovibrio sp.]|nr:MAG: 2-oxoglutarate dehydrogenase [Desulfovibrio sp.]